MADITPPVADVPTPVPQVPVEKDNSQILGVSLRGLIALVVVLTICYLAVKQIDVKEPLYSLGAMILGFYFGHQQGMSAKNKYD